MVFFWWVSPLGSAWVAHRCPITVLNVSCRRKGSTFHHMWRSNSKKDHFGCAKAKKNRPRNMTISVNRLNHGGPIFRPFDPSNTFETIKNRMRAGAQFFRHPTHRLWWVSLHQGPQILVLDYCRSTTSVLIFEAKISGTKFRKSTSNSTFINTIIAKCLFNFLAVSAALWFNLNS